MRTVAARSRLVVLVCVAAVSGGVVGVGMGVGGEPPAGVAAVPAEDVKCTVDLKLPGTMADIVSNVLLRVEKKPEDEVRAFVKDAQKKYRTGEEALSAAAVMFGVDRAKLAEQVEFWKHVNCEHAPVAGYQRPDSADASDAGGVPVAVSAFAADVTLHVVLHEMGHAVVREFDLAVLGNEETMADAFATHWLVEHMPGRALAALKARVTSLMIEAGEVPVEKWTVRGEHDNDARRAYQIAALAVAADAEKYAEVGALVGMSEREITKAKDYGADIHRAWRRTLTPIMMPTGKRSREWRFAADRATRAFVEAGEPSLETVIVEALGSIDWHSRVSVAFVGERGGAAWSRSERTITVGGEYLRRFVRQGEVAEAPPAKAGE